MNNLITINQTTIDGNNISTVNGRDLHAFLEIGKDFSTWIKDRIESFGFVENQDFVVFTDFGENLKGGRPSKDYALTLDMAKELSMVERNAKGKQARQYFIECERRAKDPLALLNDPNALRTLCIQYSEKVLERDKLIAEIAPKAQALDRIATFGDGSLCITNAAKDLQIQPKSLFKLLSSDIMKWIYKRAGGNSSWIAYQDKLQQGLLEHKITMVSRSDGSEKMTEQVLVTSKGLAKLSDFISNNGMVAQ